MAEYLFIDGYNILNKDRGLRETMKVSLEDARDAFTKRVEDYAAYRGSNIIIVFDGYSRENKTRTVTTNNNVTTVYTKKGESADAYIERQVTILLDDLPRTTTIWVATSDYLEQTIIFARGAVRLSARELIEDMSKATAERNHTVQEKGFDTPNMLSDRLDSKTLEMLKSIALKGSK
ncbi:MAG: NYN domain-containing protein [Clostridiales bacterium]|nr:NYN domain-containing protein [Clostridiales bacterium]